jgi:hypothetical protein
MYSAGYCWQIVMKLEYSLQIFEKKSQISNSMKIRPLGAEFFHADGQTDTHDEAKSPLVALS